MTTGNFIHEFWREKKHLHINVKELKGAVATVKSLSRKGDTVHLKVDNSVAFSYLHRGGGRKPQFNKEMRELWDWQHQQGLHLQVSLVTSSEDKADGLSSLRQDKGDYSLNQSVFLRILSAFRPFILPTVDVFASPGNHKLNAFICRYPHCQAFRVDALKCPLQGIQTCYANPPWTQDLPSLNRLMENPLLECLMITPL